MSRLPVSLNGPGALRSPHKGLYLEKHLAPKIGKESIAPALKDVCRIPSNHGAYKLAFNRWKRLCARPNVYCLEGRLEGRLVTGLGQESVHETGCRLHHTYGAPVIPGSGIRGALRARLAGPTNQDIRVFLFGHDEDSASESAGYTKIYDAWWIPSSNASGLAPDVITVHHQDYYGGKAGAAPTDFDSPNPVPFLSVTGSFLFAFEAPNDSWGQFLKNLAKEVLGQDGLGAKRSSGYGRFRFA